MLDSSGGDGSASDSSGWSANNGGGDSGTGVLGAEGGVGRSARKDLGNFVSGFCGGNS